MAHSPRSRAWLEWAAISCLAALVLFAMIATVRRWLAGKQAPPPSQAAFVPSHCATGDLLCALAPDPLGKADLPLSQRNVERARELLQELLARPATEADLARLDFQNDSEGRLDFFCPGHRARVECEVAYFAGAQVFWLCKDVRPGGRGRISRSQPTRL